MDVLEIVSVKEVNWALEALMCSEQERLCVGLQSRKGEINVKSDSGSKFILALLAFTQDATEINVKYFQGKLVVTIKYQNVFQI